MTITVLGDVPRLIADEVADQLTAYVHRLHSFDACFWCGENPDQFMLPDKFMHAASRLYCVACGRYSRNDLDGRIIPVIVQAWCNTRHPWHEAVLALIEAAEGDLPMLDRWGLQVSLGVVPYSGLPNSANFRISHRDAPTENVSVYDWTFFEIIRPAINQSVSSRLDATPHFDLASRSACLNCGAGPDEHQMRNFSQVLREGDIFCGRCGKFIRTWDPN